MANSVRSRIQLGSTTYGRSSDGRGWIAIDKQQILTMTWTTTTGTFYPPGPAGERQREEDIRHAHATNIFSRDEWHAALFHYLNMSIDTILSSEHPLIRAIGMLDARVGKRRLLKMDLSDQHELVRKLYLLRCECEHLDVRPDAPEGWDLTSPLKRPHWPSVYDLAKERRQEATKKLVKGKRTRNLKTFIRACYEQRISPEALDTEPSQVIFREFTESDDPHFLFETLQLLETTTKLIRQIKHIRGVLALVRHPSRWLRSLDTWRPSSHNPDRQFSSLARHLFAEYEVPVFMDQAWLEGDALQQEWFLHLGAGQNIRTAPGLPIPLTKKMAHHFLAAPDHYSVEGALTWGQVHAVGGDRRLADALLESRLAVDPHDNDFRLSLIRFFVRNPMLDSIHVSPIVDYIWHQKYEPQIVFPQRGVAEERGPAQPNFSMRGRTVNALLRQVEAWHRRLGRQRKGGDLQWKHSAVADYQFVEGTKDARDMKVWRIRELLSSQELIEEGRQQRHCVATYAQSCHCGRCSVWTMEVETDTGSEKCVTIEVRSADKVIRQVRGKYNRRPTEKEKQILGRWATQEGLAVASYLW